MCSIVQATVSYPLVRPVVERLNLSLIERRKRNATGNQIQSERPRTETHRTDSLVRYLAMQGEHAHQQQYPANLNVLRFYHTFKI